MDHRRKVEKENKNKKKTRNSHQLPLLDATLVCHLKWQRCTVYEHPQRMSLLIGKARPTMQVTANLLSHWPLLFFTCNNTLSHSLWPQTFTRTHPVSSSSLYLFLLSNFFLTSSFSFLPCFLRNSFQN